MSALLTRSLLVAAACAALAACVDVPAKKPLISVSLDACLATVLEKYPGQVTRYELVKGQKWKDLVTYHAFAIYPGDGTSVGVGCDVNSGIMQVMWKDKASPAHDPYRTPPQVSEEQARWAALQLSDGTVLQMIYYTQPKPHYTYVLLTPENSWLKIEVDGTSGEALPVVPELAGIPR